MKQKAIITLTSDSDSDGVNVSVKFIPEITDESGSNTAAYLAMELVKALPKIAGGEVVDREAEVG